MIGQVKVSSEKESLNFSVPIYLGDLDPSLIRVEIYANGVENQKEMTFQNKTESKTYLYSGSVSANRDSSDYTVRIIPRIADLKVPLEIPLILWQH